MRNIRLMRYMRHSLKQNYQGSPDSGNGSYAAVPYRFRVMQHGSRSSPGPPMSPPHTAAVPRVTPHSDAGRHRELARYSGIKRSQARSPLFSYQRHGQQSLEVGRSNRPEEGRSVSGGSSRSAPIPPCRCLLRRNGSRRRTSPCSALIPPCLLCRGMYLRRTLHDYRLPSRVLSSRRRGGTLSHSHSKLHLPYWQIRSRRCCDNRSRRGNSNHCRQGSCRTHSHSHSLRHGHRNCFGHSLGSGSTHSRRCRHSRDHNLRHCCNGHSGSHKHSLSHSHRNCPRSCRKRSRGRNRDSHSKQ
mmetsp:Transcript_12763/g.38483  ORF Transcript_12763/g.38483 Transcript_12763/m.38483 type:complete len:299 (+) Transcript_12763:3868-4764(+)